VQRKLAVLLALGIVAGSLTVSAPPAHAALAGGVKCHASLGLFPGAGSVTCSGIVVGAQVKVTTAPPGATTQVCVPSCPFVASGAYNEPCVPGVPAPPPLGFFQGTFTVGGVPSGGIDWTRVGLTALVLPKGSGTTAGAAVFLPALPTGQCPPGTALPLEADVVGVAVGT